MFIENDANCFALAEATYGAGQITGLFRGNFRDWLRCRIVVIEKFMLASTRLRVNLVTTRCHLRMEDCVGAAEGLR